MSDLSSLIARLEKAERPSRKMEAEIAMALGIIPDREWWSIDYLKSDVIGRYTSSIDAAVSLAERVLSGWRYAIERRTGGMCLAWVTEEDDAPCIPAMHPHSAIALVLATLRALQQKGSSNG